MSAATQEVLGVILFLVGLLLIVSLGFAVADLVKEKRKSNV